jgi:hypothetical protein
LDEEFFCPVEWLTGEVFPDGGRRFVPVVADIFEHVDHPLRPFRVCRHGWRGYSGIVGRTAGSASADESVRRPVARHVTGIGELVF